MGFKDCVITLDNPWSTYYAGQTVNGRADVILDAPKKIRGVFVTFKGESETSWNVNRTRRDNDGKSHEYTEKFSGNEEYFTISYYLVGSKGGGEIELPSGRHTYNFTCALPPTLPSSFEGEYGFVRYTIKVVLDRPWKFDHETKMAFTVISPLDLNLNPTYKAPFRIQMEDSFCCCWCKSGPLSIDITAPVSGYCSGQSLPIHIDCENHSGVRVQKITVKLQKKTVFRVLLPQRDSKESIVEIGKFEVGPLENEAVSYDKLIEIPPLPPSNLTNCSLIDVDYYVAAEAKVSGMHCNLSKMLPITIGTVPLVGFDSPAPPAVNQLPQTPSKPPPPPGYPIETGPTPVAPQGPPSYPVQPQNTPYPSSPPQNPPQPPTNGDQSGGGWNMPNAAVPHQNIYPQLAAPVYQAAPYANAIKDSGDNEHTRIAGQTTFAPFYPTYASNPQQKS